MEDVWRSFLVCLVMRIRLIEVCVYMLCDLVSDTSPECSQSLSSCYRVGTFLIMSNVLRPCVQTARVRCVKIVGHLAAIAVAVAVADAICAGRRPPAHMSVLFAGGSLSTLR